MGRLATLANVRGRTDLVMALPAENKERTSSSLLVGVRAHDAASWRRLVDLYGPLVYHWCRRAALSPEDVADVAQEVFRSVATGIGTFHKAQSGGTFCGWLHTITHNKIRDHFRARASQVEATGGTDAQQMLLQLPGEAVSNPGSTETPALQDLVRRALEQIRGDFEQRTWDAFCQGVLQGRGAAQIGTELRMSANAVRKAKARVLQRLREELGERE